MDMNGVLDACLDSTHTILNTISVGSANAAQPPSRDLNGMWDAVYDRATNSIRVVEV